MVISMDRWKGKVAVVTGASSGIGAAIAERLVQEGLMVVGLASDKDKIEELAQKLESKCGKLYAFETDMTKEEDILKAFQWIKKNVGPVHILINSAEAGRNAKLIDGDTKSWKEVIDTNILALCIATREAIRDMQANDVTGHIVHINSIAGHNVPKVPTMNVYSASKHAVTALSEALRQELVATGSKIKTTSVSPGCVETGIFETNAKASGSAGLPSTRPKSLQMLPTLQPKDVADSVLYLLGTPPHVKIHELTIKPLGEPF